jgi:hypothetical protein
MVQLNSTSEIIDVNQADQFQSGRSQFECGYFACAMAKSMSKPGTAPTLTVAQVISDAESWYAQYDGSDAISNVNGMTTEQEYELLTQIGLHFQSTSTDVDTVKKWVAVGYPVIIGVYEAPIHDVALNANPYPWTPAGTHVILVTGLASGGNVLVRDSANCTNLYDPNSLRPGPRTYVASSLQLVSATVVVPPWMPRPTSGIPPTAPVQEIDDMSIDINSPGVGNYFTETDANHWTCKNNGKVLQFGVLAFYKQQGGLQRLGLPVSNEIPLATGASETRQHFERGAVFFDPTHKYDSPPGAGQVYYAHIYSGPAWDAVIAPYTTAPVDTAALVAAINGIADGVAKDVAIALVEAKKL